MFHFPSILKLELTNHIYMQVLIGRDNPWLNPMVKRYVELEGPATRPRTLQHLHLHIATNIKVEGHLWTSNEHDNKTTTATPNIV